MGWTVTLAIFLQSAGINKLPLLLAANALLVMASSLIFSEILKRTRQEIVMMTTVLLASGLLLFSSLFAHQHSILFVMGILVVQSTLLSQVNLLATVFTEDLFSPLESQRAFPLVATAETIGGIVGGFAITLLNPWIPAYKFITLWAIALLSLIPLLILSRRVIKKLPSLEIKKCERERTRLKIHPIKAIQAGVKRMKKSRLLRGLGALVFLQFLLLNVMEFQYTKAVEETVREQSNRMVFEVNEYQPESQLEVALLQVTSIDTEAQATAIEHELAKKLATLQIIFSAGSLLVHVLLTSRILNHLGIVGTLFVHPLVTVVHSIALLVRFDFLTAGIARSSFEVTRGMFQNAYHSSYYILSETTRTQIKELMEGLIKPLGAFAAFGILLLIQSGFPSSDQTWVANLILVTVSLALLLPLLGMQKKYARFAERQLLHNEDLPSRFNAVEILAQQGEPAGLETLTNRLQDVHENRRLKLKILETLKLQGKPECFALLLETLNHKHIGLKTELLETMNHIKGLEALLEKQPFLRHHAIETLQSTLKKARSRDVQSEAIQLLAKIGGGRMTEFFLEQLQQGTPQVQAAVLKACRIQQDPGMIPYARPLLASPHPEVQAEAMLTLWAFEKEHPAIETALKILKTDEEKAPRIAALQVLGHLNRVEDLPFLMEQLAHPQFKVREAATQALAKRGHGQGLESLIELLKHENPHVVHRNQKFARELGPLTLKKLEQRLHLKISEHIQSLLNGAKAASLNELDRKTLKRLQQAYAVVNEHEEVLKIETILGIPNRPSHAAAFA